jgi:MYXO-CTERM domain-containing protein
LGPTFSWINHSWDHPILDGLSYADVLTEFTRNDTYLRGLGLTPYATANVVTPSISGLASADAMRAIHDAGIRQLVSDTSEPGQDNPSPNAGLWNALQPSVLEIPRIPTNLDYDVSQPAEWIPEYEATVTKGATIDYPAMIDQTSDNLLRDLLNGNNDPWMFHQANTRDYDGAGHSLLSDLLTATFDKYAAVATLPIVSPTMDDLAARVMNRMTLDASGVVATIRPGTSLTISVTAAATVPVTGLCVPGAESYGGQTISYLSLAAGQSITLSLADCNPGYGAGGAGGASGASGTAGASGAGGAGVAGTSGSSGGINGAGGSGGTAGGTAGGMAGTGAAGAAGGPMNVDGGATGGAGAMGGATSGMGGGAMGGGAMCGGAMKDGGAGGGTSGGKGAGGGSGSGEGGQAGQASRDAATTAPDSGAAGKGGGTGGAAGAPGSGNNAGAGCDCRVGDGTPGGGALLLGLLALVGARRTRRRQR